MGYAQLLHRVYELLVTDGDGGIAMQKRRMYMQEPHVSAHAFLAVSPQCTASSLSAQSRVMDQIAWSSATLPPCAT
eukprot:6380651-Pyramimonas_sp.AAC.1